METLKTIRVLYVEDDIDHANLITKMLSTYKKVDYQIEHSDDLQSGIDYLKSINCNVDVVLLDLMLPNSQGVNTFKQIYNVCVEVPIVIMSGFEDIANKCIELGAQDYLVKPDISPSLVSRSLEYAIERKKLLDKQKIIEERFKLLSDASFEGVTITRDAIFLDVNEQFCNIVDAPREDIIGKKITEFVAPEYKDLVYNNLIKNREEPYEHIARKKDGTRFPVEIHGRTLADGLRLTAIRDMTRYKKAESALRKSEEKYRDLVEATGACIYEIDYKRMKFLYVNDVLCKLSGWSREELMAMNPSDLLTKQGLGQFVERMSAIERGEMVPETHEYEIRIKDGSSKWTIINTVFKKDKENKITGASVVAIDITERKIAQYEAEKKEELIFNHLEKKIQEWREELSLKSLATKIKLDEITLNISSMSTSKEVQ